MNIQISLGLWKKFLRIAKHKKMSLGSNKTLFCIGWAVPSPLYTRFRTTTLPRGGSGVAREG